MGATSWARTVYPSSFECILGLRKILHELCVHRKILSVKKNLHELYGNELNNLTIQKSYNTSIV
jgi:hypothetical protein